MYEYDDNQTAESRRTRKGRHRGAPMSLLQQLRTVRGGRRVERLPVAGPRRARRHS